MTESIEAGAPAAMGRALLDWYAWHARRLPWRVSPADRARGLRAAPYAVLLSEVMLQQTTAAAVAPYFERFLQRWPTLLALAAAEDTEVMAAWAGLGYYARARNLLKAARAVAASGGELPREATALRALPGVGAYTAAAVAAIAFDERVAAIDGNVERVVSRVFAIETPLPASRREIAERVSPIVPPDRPGEFAEALMDLGATVCTPRRPACGLCPWNAPCEARRSGEPTRFPVKAKKAARPERFGAAFVALREDGAVLLRRRPPEGLLGGMAEVPGTPWEAKRRSAAADGAPFRAAWEAVGQIEHGFTHFSLRLDVFRASFPGRPPAPAGMWWSPPEQIGAEALPTVMRKVVARACDGASSLPFGD